MSNVKKRIIDDALKQFIKNRGSHADPAMYFDNKVLKKGEKIDLFEKTIKIEEPTNLVFIDEQPGLNWGHACQYLLYQADKGKLINKVDAKFPPFLTKNSVEGMEIFKTPRILNNFEKRRTLKFPLDPARLTAYTKLRPLPFRLTKVEGRRYAIFFSGGSNCRHVNDMEFFYRTLLDIYAYNPSDIFICNYDGNINWIKAGWWEPAQDLANPINYPVDNTPFRMQVDEPGTRNGFQSIIAQLTGMMKRYDCLLIHTNNHGWYGNKPGGANDEGFISLPGSSKYWASDFVSDLSNLPQFKNLLVVMEQCSSGSFIQPIMNNSPADNTVVQTAVPAKESSAGGWYFDPWIELWISAMAGVRGDGSALAVSPDDDLDSKISAFEAYDYALGQDNPQMDESTADFSKKVFLTGCTSWVKKPYKEFKEYAKEYHKEQLKDYHKDQLKDGSSDFEKREKDFVKEHVKEVMKDHKEIYEGKAMARDDFEKMQDIPGEHVFRDPIGPEIIRGLEGRIRSLEKSINKITPFIKSNLRPDIKGKAFGDSGGD
jgi:hypothetical protein